MTDAVKEEIENSRVFQTIRRLPKGGIIHVHDFSMTSIDWVIKNITYRNNLYMCICDDYAVLLMFCFCKVTYFRQYPHCVPYFNSQAFVEYWTEKMNSLLDINKKDDPKVKLFFI